MKVFPYRLKELRQWKGVTQVQLAEELGVSQFSVSMWERGEQIPRAGMMLRIANYFELMPDTLNTSVSDSESDEVLSQWNAMYSHVSKLSPEKQTLLFKVVEAFINAD